MTNTSPQQQANQESATTKKANQLSDSAKQIYMTADELQRAWEDSQDGNRI